MNGEQPTGPERRPDHPALRLDAACDRFEAAWKAGRRPRIEDSLGEATESERTPWLRALLEVELDFRRGAGEAPTPDEYRGRFPEHPQLIADAFAESHPWAGAEPTVRKRSAADSNLLFGILALQNNFIGRDALVDAFNAWIADKSRPLAQVLRDRGHLDTAHGALLEALAREHLKLHGGDPQESLAALSSLGSAHYVLRGITDPDVQASLHGTAVGRPEEPGAAARMVRAGAPASGVSRFRILRPHAKGGLGEVFVAFDDELHREVALKEIQTGRADDRESRTRFVLEAEITGNLEHPGVVPVYGLGHYGNGRPFYAMRFVQGDSLKTAIARFHAADIPGRNPGERALAVRGLLGRFIDVCDAIAYAHSRGVLHRDLKPGNIMLGKYGETLVVDWGLAKTAGQAKGGEGNAPGRPLRPHSASGSAPTVAGVALGTPGFMSPEQAAGDLDRLGPRSDVYSLGATLYCLLTGRAPLEAGGGDVEEVLRRVRAGDIAPLRRVKRDVPAALEAVCLNAMALRPEDRYASARALAEDIEHWLADEPVTAWREPWPMRARRWAKRHRTAVAATVVALVAGVVGLGGVAGVQARANVRLSDANAATNQALADTRKAQAETQATLKFLQDKVLAAARPEDQDGGLGINATIRAAVDAAEPAIAESFANQPTVEASIRNTLGESYLHLGEPALAIRQLEPALALRQQVLGPSHPDTMISMSQLAVTYQAAGRLTDALTLFEETLKRRQVTLGPDHVSTLQSMSDLAWAYQEAGRLAEALPRHEAALERQQVKLGPDHPDTLTSMNYLALAYQEAGRLSDALPLFKETLERRQATLGPDHPNTLQSMNNLALAYRGADQLDDALSLQEEILTRVRVKLGPDHPHALICMNNLANAYQVAGRLSDALPLHEEELRRTQAKLGADHTDTLISMNNLAMAYQAAGRLSDALPLFEASLKGRQAKLSPDHPASLLSMNNLAMAYQAAGRLSDALPLFEASLRGRRAIRGPDHPDTLVSMNNLARVYLTDKPAEAEPLLREALAIREKKDADDWRTFETRSLLGGSLVGQKKYAEAELFLLQGYEGMKAREAKIPASNKKRLAEAAVRIVRLYEAFSKPDQAAAWKAKLGIPDLPTDVFARP